MAEDFKLNRPLYTDKEKTMVLEEGDPKSAFVIGGKGSVVSEDDVKKYGLDEGHRLKEDEKADKATEVDSSVEMGTVTPKESKAASAAETAEKGEEEASGEDVADLKSLTVPKLKELAEKEEVDLAGVTLKDDIIAAIEKKRKG